MVDTSLADFQAGVLTSCDATTIPGAVTLVVAPLIDQQNTTVTPNGFGFTATSWAGQTFVPSVSGALTRVDLDLFCSGCSGTTPDLAVSIRATTGSPGVPTGADLATATITGFSASGGGYFSAVFNTPVTVTAGTQYAVVMHPVTNPSAGVYAYVCSCTTSTNPYTSGSRVTSSNSGASWTADITTGGRDLGFAIYVGSGFVASGTLASSNKDANPSAGDAVHWSTLSWSSTAPASTTLQFQAAASNDPAGPFSFVGPDGTAATFFTSGDSLAQFDGNRYLEYKALFATTDSTQTATLQDVTACFSNAPSIVSTTLTVSPASAAFGATVDLAAVLSGNGSGVAGRTVTFTLDSVAAGTATTDSQGTATVTGVSLSGVEPGVYTGAVAATYDGEPGFTASSGSSDLTVTKAAQVISFGALSGKLMTDSAFAVGATGGASGNPVTFSTSSPACSVTGTTVTLVAAGPCAIQADQAGNTEYFNATPVTQSFTIALAPQTISFPAIASFSWSGGSATLAATASSALAASYSVQSGPCSVAGSTLTATGAGTCVVAANQAGNATYGPASQVTASATVTRAGQMISFGPLSGKLMTDGAFSVSATGGASGNPITFSTASPACSVTGATVTLVAAGLCAIQADQAGSADYSAATPVTQSFTIARASQTIAFPAITSFSWSGSSATLAATASSLLAVAYTVQSGPCSVAGLTLTATAAGTCVVAANQAGNAAYSPASQVTATATVLKAAQTISFGPLASKLMTDGAFTVGATGGTSGNPVTFSTVSAACSVTGTSVTLVAAGSCALQADQAGNADYTAAAPAIQAFTISRAAQTIGFPAITSFSWSGGSATLAAAASSALAVTYSVQSGPCSVSGSVLTATAPGSCVVAANQPGDTRYVPAPQVTATATVTKASQTIAFPAISGFVWSGGSATLAATASSGLAIAYSVLSGPCNLAGVTLSATAPGVCTVAADQAGDGNYTAALRVSATAAVAQASQAISFPAIAGFAWSAGSATLAATASSGLAIAYSVQSGPCSVAGATLTAAAAGSCVVAADQAGNGAYTAALRVTATVTVTAGTQTITFPAIAGFSWSTGTATLTATTSSGLAISYSVQAGPCSITGAVLTATAAGSCTVAADQAGDVNYTAAARATATASVTRADQAISFSALAARLANEPAFALSATSDSSNPVVFSTSSAACTVSGATVTLVTAGACAIEADQPADANYNAAAPVMRSFTISLAPQAISFPVLAAFSWSGGSATVAATASSSLAISYSVRSGPCSIAGTTVTATTAGTCVVAADQSGDTRYLAAPHTSTTVTVTRADQAIAFPVITTFSRRGGSATLDATSSSGLPIAYHVQSGPCSIAGTTLTATAPGTCVVTADQGGSSSYNAAPQVSASVIVSDTAPSGGGGCSTTQGGGLASIALLVLIVAGASRRRRRG